MYYPTHPKHLPTNISYATYVPGATASREMVVFLLKSANKSGRQCMAVDGMIQVALSVELNQAHRLFVAKLCSVSVAMTMRGTGREYTLNCIV